MAKVRRTRKTRALRDPDDNGALPVTAEISPALEALIKAIKPPEGGDWGIFTTGNPIHVQGKKHDGAYRTVPFTGAEEFTFVNVYLGKRGNLIFVFRPLDQELYVQIELEESKVFGVPTFEKLVAQALDPEIATDIFDQDGDAFRYARSKFIKAFNDQARKAVIEAEQAAVKAATERKDQDPNWGIF